VTALELVPAGGGCFEVSVDGKPLHSKLETGTFPEERAVLSRLEKERAR